MSEKSFYSGDKWSDSDLEKMRAIASKPGSIVRVSDAGDAMAMTMWAELAHACVPVPAEMIMEVADLEEPVKSIDLLAKKARDFWDKSMKEAYGDD